MGESKKYEVVVLAQSGMNAATNGKRVAVTVTDNPSDPPLFDEGYSAPLEVPENTGPNTDIGNPISASDQNGLSLTYSLRGTHASHFAIDSATGQLKTKAALNYEPRNTYSVKVRPSNGSRTSDAPVTINVLNVDEDGTVTFSTSSPRARTPFTARLTDPDGSITGITWQWDSSTDGNSWTTISGETSATFSPADEQVSKYLRATASYIDGEGAGKSAQGQSTNMVSTGPNRSPSLRSITTTLTFSVPENTVADTEIGTPVTADDIDGDTLTYALVGAKASAFSIAAATGQLKTRAALNHEAKSSYTLTVRARDPSNSYVNITVEINVTDVDEAGTVTLSQPRPPPLLYPP